MSYVDIAIIALVVLFGIVGVFRGVKKSALAFVAFIIAFLISFFLAKVVAEALLGVEAIRVFVMGNDPESKAFSLYKWLNENILVGNDKIVMFAGETAPSDYVNTHFFTPIISLVDNPDLLSETFTLSNAVALCTSFTIFTGIVGVGLFIVIRILLCLVTMIIKALIGKKKTWLGRLGGFGVGIIRGACWSVVLTFLFTIISGLTFVPALGKAQTEFERGVLSPYANQAAYTIKNKLFLPDADMFERIVIKSGLVVKEEDETPTIDIAGYERDLYISFMNLNYTDDAYSYDLKSGKILFNEGAHELDPAGYVESGFDTVITAIKQYNAEAGTKIRTDRIFAETDNGTMTLYITMVQDDPTNSIRDQWLAIRTAMYNYENKIGEAKLQSTQEGKEEYNNILKTMYNDLKTQYDTLAKTYKVFASTLGELTFELPEVYQLAVE